MASGKLATGLAVFVGAIVVGTSAALAISSAPKMPLAPKIVDAGPDAMPDSGELVISTVVLGDAAAPLPELDGSTPLLLADEKPDLPIDGGSLMMTNAPRQVRFGVILVQYAGCQGAPPTARPKSAALDLANSLDEQAKKDFHDAVKHGDSGSMDDAGRIPRGVLEPPVEVVLFSLPVAGVSDVIDTPRGFWIVRRSE